MANLTGQVFKIGAVAGHYPEGGSLTDSFFELVTKTGAEISSITYGSQTYGEGWVLTGRKLDFSSLFNTANGTQLFVNLNQTISVQ